MKSEHYFHVVDPEVIGNEDGTMLILRFQTVGPVPGGYKRTGKFVHLELTNKFAMQLMGSLRRAQEALSLPDPGEADVTEVPPHSKRN